MVVQKFTKNMLKFLSEITRLFLMIFMIQFCMILYDHNYDLNKDYNPLYIYEGIIYVIFSLFYMEIYDIINAIFLNFIGDILGGSLLLTLFIRFFFISDDG